MAPIHFSPILFISFSGFFLILNESLVDRTARQQRWMAVWLGWCFGFGYFLAGLWWIGTAVLVDGPTFAWALPFAVAGLPAVLALFWGLACTIALMFWRSNSLKILSLVFFLTFAEYFRGFILTGFPWNAIGYAAMPNALFMQSASVIGLWGVTAFTFLAAFSPALLVLPSNRKEHARRKALLACVVLSLVAHTGFGAVRLLQAEPGIASGDPIKLRLLQPNIAQQDKWRQGNEEAVFQSYLDLSSAPGLDDMDALIWPESAFPFLVMQRPDALSRLDALLPVGVRLLSGAVRVKPPEMSFSDAPPKLKFYNAMIDFNDRAVPIGYYDKQHLVPFGEFIPFGDLVERFGISNLVNMPGGFAPGVGGNMMRFDVPEGAESKLPPAQILICYEAIFPNFSSRSSILEDDPSQPDDVAIPAEPAQWILNITNDAWFGSLAGPYQHFHQARVRAVEEGLPLIRVANTGISAAVDPYGRIQQSLPMGTAGIIDTELPSALPATFQKRFPDVLFAIVMAILGLLLLNV
ncbi:UNVERIFIED_CONTAM: hypothetical protein GTU68_050369 [Idotea baltica]|nr:hypothetical protein [Idotea baltica]